MTPKNYVKKTQPNFDAFRQWGGQGKDGHHIGQKSVKTFWTFFKTNSFPWSCRNVHSVTEHCLTFDIVFKYITFYHKDTPNNWFWQWGDFKAVEVQMQASTNHFVFVVITCAITVFYDFSQFWCFLNMGQTGKRWSSHWTEKCQNVLDLFSKQIHFLEVVEMFTQ